MVVKLVYPSSILETYFVDINLQILAVEPDDILQHALTSDDENQATRPKWNYTTLQKVYTPPKSKTLWV